MKVIIDTDIGDDVDDALALALALSSPELDVLAVTTVHGRVDIRAKLASKILKTYDKPYVPVAMGARKPLLNPEPTHIPNQAPIAENDEYPNITEKRAPDLIIETLEEEKDVTLITLGPLTNVALALLENKEAFKNAKLVIMGGCVTRPVAEYNIKSDPEAAAIVLNSGLPITLVGLDVTLKCEMTDDMLNLIDVSEKSQVKLLREFLRYWMKVHRRRPILHDPLAVAVSFNRELVEIVRKCVAVELWGKYTRGYTVILPSEEQNVGVCIDVNYREFLELYKKRVLA